MLVRTHAKTASLTLTSTVHALSGSVRSSFSVVRSYAHTPRLPHEPSTSTVHALSGSVRCSFVMLRTQANTSAHGGSERAQACLSEPAWRERARHAKPACASASPTSRPMHSPTSQPMHSPTSLTNAFSHESTDGFSREPIQHKSNDSSSCCQHKE